ncbi:MAG: cofactor-independent phosphoglycerate mutase [Prevotella sp.]|nr:cofactor-independent phosphoglycerate mutase [Prevotella sp.]
MKHIIILGDGMSDHKVKALDNKTPLAYQRPSYINKLAREGRCGMLRTIPANFPPGSEVANTAILGYDLNKVYEGRGPLEAASIGYEMQEDDLAIRCNIITLENDKIITHNGGNLQTDEASILIDYLNEHLANDKVRFITGIQYRHLLIIKGGNKNIICNPPHDHPNEYWKPLLVKAVENAEENNSHHNATMSPQETADLINELIIKSQDLLSRHQINIKRKEEGKRQANSIWPWSGGYRPSMQKLSDIYPQVRSGAVITAVDLIKGIGHYAGLQIINVEGATGLANTNYEGKAQAAIDALKVSDFVFVHVEATDEAGHDGDIALKLKAIDYLDQRLLKPIIKAIEEMDEPVCVAVLPDHPTPVEMRIHVNEPVPFLIWHKDISADEVHYYDEESCQQGAYGTLESDEFIKEFMSIN